MGKKKAKTAEVVETTAPAEEVVETSSDTITSEEIASILEDDGFFADLLGDDEDVAEADGDAIAEAEGEIAIEAEIKEGYEALEDSDPEPKATASDDEVAATKPKRVSIAGKKPSEILTARYGDAIAEKIDTGFDYDVENILEIFDAAPKKVGEKIVNLINHVHGGVTLSVYTSMALELLKSGGTTYSEIFDAYLARPYSKGTAAAQTGQMVHLFVVLGLATYANKTFTLIETSPLLALLSAPATAEAEVEEAA